MIRRCRGGGGEEGILRSRSTDLSVTLHMFEICSLLCWQFLALLDSCQTSPVRMDETGKLLNFASFFSVRQSRSVWCVAFDCGARMDFEFCYGSVVVRFEDNLNLVQLLHNGYDCGGILVGVL